MKGKKDGGKAVVQQAFVSLRELPGTRVSFWVVDSCPYCGERHFHPAGTAKDDPGERLTVVTAPCNRELSYRLSLPPRPKAKGGKRAQKRRERHESRRWDEDDWE